MRPFTMVSPYVWQSERFNALSDTGKLLFLYMLSSPHQTSAGVCRLLEGYVCTDLKWDAPVYQRAKNELITARMIQVDDQTHEILIELWFKHSPPKTGAHYMNAEKFILSLASQRLREVAQEALKPTWNPEWKGPRKLAGASGGDNGANNLVTTLRDRMNK